MARAKLSAGGLDRTLTEVTSTQRPINRAAAKQELGRINKFLKEPLLLIGGLAVQQYHEPRDSYDIDLVCEFELANSIIDTLYPSLTWTIKNDQDEHRPRIILTHKVSGLIIHFGPKIVQRGEYPHLSWASLMPGSEKFRTGGDNYLEFIRVPSPHGLAYTKMLSFIGRYKTSTKSKQDLADFVNLSNHEAFKISELHNLILRHAADGIIQDGMRAILADDVSAREKLSDSCISYFMQFWPSIQTKSISNLLSPPPTKTLYYAAPHKNVDTNAAISSHLKDAGFSVKLPFEEVQRATGNPTPRDPHIVRQVCIDCISSSDALVVDVDRYGLDTAWELGFGEGLGKSIFGINHEIAVKSAPRMVNRRQYTDNFMHGWDTQVVHKDIQSALPAVAGLGVYICGSFAQPNALELKSSLKKTASKVIFPKDYIPTGVGMPRDYPLSTRVNAINQIDDCDVVVVMLPRYGMDSAWQIGYATAKKKTIVGVLLADDGNAGDDKLIWDHWMHGWHEKDIFTGRARLCAALKGYLEAGIL